METKLQIAYVDFALQKLQEIYKASKSRDQPCDFLQPRLLFLTFLFHDLTSDPERSADAADGILKVLYRTFMDYTLNGHIHRKWPRQPFMMTFIDKEGSGAGYRDPRGSIHAHGLLLLNDAVLDRVKRIMVLTDRVSDSGADIYTLRHRFSNIGIRQVDLCYIEPMTLGRVISYAGKVATHKLVDESGVTQYPPHVGWDRWLSRQRGQYNAILGPNEMSVAERAFIQMMQRRRTKSP